MPPTPIAPLQPQPPEQRLGWLAAAGVTSLRCVRDIPPFVAGRDYRVCWVEYELNKYETRPRPSAGDERVKLIGTDLIAMLDHPRRDKDATLRRTAFTRIPVLDQSGEFARYYHIVGLSTYGKLCEHFHIPDVIDAARANPQLFQRHVEALKRMETP